MDSLSQRFHQTFLRMIRVIQHCFALTAGWDCSEEASRSRRIHGRWIRCWICSETTAEAAAEQHRRQHGRLLHCLNAKQASACAPEINRQCTRLRDSPGQMPRKVTGSVVNWHLGSCQAGGVQAGVSVIGHRKANRVSAPENLRSFGSDQKEIRLGIQGSKHQSVITWNFGSRLSLVHLFLYSQSKVDRWKTCCM
jgi:hypothetical protein